MWRWSSRIQKRNFNSPFKKSPPFYELKWNMKFIYYPLVLLWLSIFGQVVLWFGQAKYTLYLSEGTSELKRKFLALQLYWQFALPRVKLHEGNPGEIDFSSRKREVRVSEGLSCWESTVHVYRIDCIHVDLCVAGTDSPPSNASAAWTRIL